MEKFSIKIKNKLRSFISFKKMNPHIYWNNLLYIFFIIIVILILFSLYLLFEIKNQQIFQITPISIESPILINEKVFNRVNESFENKLIKQKEIQDNLNSYKYKDPSIN